MVNHPNRKRADPAVARERHLARRIYMAFRIGARLTSQDIHRLLAVKGLAVSNDQLLSMDELQALVSAWAVEQGSKR